MGLPVSSRLRRPYNFQDIRREGQLIDCGPFIVQCRISAHSGPSRLGLVTSRRVGKAVKRNYGRRIFRELFRKYSFNLPLGSDLVIVLRSSFDRYKYADLELRLLRAFGTINEMYKSDLIEPSN
ncbi:MAG: ribonuclease P protein component [Verrucomicrobiota bacterium]|nr:ribonuclease P protein component [Verrucomicrobiota bacterium]